MTTMCDVPLRSSTFFFLWLYRPVSDADGQSVDFGRGQAAAHSPPWRGPPSAQRCRRLPCGRRLSLRRSASPVVPREIIGSEFSSNLAQGFSATGPAATRAGIGSSSGSSRSIPAARGATACDPSEHSRAHERSSFWFAAV